MPQLSPDHRAWIDEAVRRVEADANRSADTHLHQFPWVSTGSTGSTGGTGVSTSSISGAGSTGGTGVSTSSTSGASSTGGTSSTSGAGSTGGPDVQLYLKDESVHPTGSLKHRLARSLFLYALCNGWLHAGSTVVEASSGSTAVSEAYFARLIGLPFVAVMPRSTSPEKVALIEWYGGRCHFVESAGAVYDEARRLAAECDGHYMDQFTYAERATDWRGNNNIAQSIFEQMRHEPHPVPAWIVVSAGTGGTSATIGRYLHYQRHPTRLMVADPEGSAFYDGWAADTSAATAPGSRIEGIGRPRIEPSFVGGVVDDMLRVPDGASIAAMRWVSDRLGRAVGGSTGTNVWAALQVITRMREADESGSVVTLLCDGGDRYASTYYSDGWVADQGIDPAPYAAALAAYDRTGLLPPV